MEESQVHWYAIRAFWNKTQPLVREAQQAGWRTYVAVKTMESIENGKLEYREDALVPSLFFVRSTEAWVKAFKQLHFHELMVYTTAGGTAPAVIRDQEMETFILVTSAGNNAADLEVLEPKPQYAQGDLVRVTEGIYKGATGIVKRIRKDRKLLVAISGVAVVAVSHIPLVYLEKIETV